MCQSETFDKSGDDNRKRDTLHRITTELAPTCLTSVVRNGISSFIYIIFGIKHGYCIAANQFSLLFRIRSKGLSHQNRLRAVDLVTLQ
jgi:hypothetical protein